MWGPCSNLDLTAELDHAVRRNREEFCRREGVAMHEREELDLDPTPSRLARWHYREPTNEKRSGRHVETELLCGTGIEDLRNIRLLHKAIMDNNGMEI